MAKAIKEAKLAFLKKVVKKAKKKGAEKKESGEKEEKGEKEDEDEEEDSEGGCGMKKKFGNLMKK